MHTLDDFSGLIATVIGKDHDFKVFEILGKRAAQCMLQQICPIAGWNDDREQGRVHYLISTAAGS